MTVVSGGRGPEEQHTSLFSDFMLWIVTAVPVQDVFAVQESVIYLGATACLGGLFSSGKYRWVSFMYLVSNTTLFSNCLKIMILISYVQSLASFKQKSFYRMKIV